ncbi:target of Nesh-SH3 isoform X7 [Hyperolius riggenbachi]|uniref:target of Nesh-SH3 isoform X7 n=1 Tax=Hyperolius riggenbachi TaxID=752182 RepID=UPI0035A289D1
MISRIFFLFVCGIISAHLGFAQKLPKVKKLNMKVHFNISGDTLVMKFHTPSQNMKLEGFILGYGSNYFSNQYIPWPENGKSYITDVDAETRYLIAVKPNENHKKSCKEKNSSQKPIQLVIGTLTPTSVFLSWGILINPQIDWSALTKCPNDRFYTVRYREKNKDWNFQLCPTTETVIDNLRPNTLYEFGVKDNTDDGVWSKPQTHKTIPKGKENGNLENTYKIPKGTLQYASEDTKALVPVIVVKQGYQNITKSPPTPSTASPVKVETKKTPLTTTRSTTSKPKPVSKVTDSPEIPKSSEKNTIEDPKPVTSQPIVESFTPDSSTGTLEWVRATMVTHPYIQVANIATESPAIGDHSPPLVLVQESNGFSTEAPDLATEESLPSLEPLKDIIADISQRPSKQLTSQSPVLARTRPSVNLASPTTAAIPFTKELPVIQPETVLASDWLAPQTPEGITIPYTEPAGEEPAPAGSAPPDVGIDLSPEHHRTITAAKQKKPVYGSTSKSTLKKTQTYRATSHPVPTKQTNPSSKTLAKATTAFTPGHNIVTTPQSVVKTAAPPPMPATTSHLVPPKQTTSSSKSVVKSTTAFTGSHNIVTTPQSVVKTAAPPPMPATTSHHVPPKQTTLSSKTLVKATTATTSHPVPTKQTTTPSKTLVKTTTAFTRSHNIVTIPQSVVKTAAPPPMPATTSHHVPPKQTTLSSNTLVKSTTAFTRSHNIVATPQSIVKTAVPPPMPVPSEILQFYPKPISSTEVPDSEVESTHPGSEINTADASPMYEPEKHTLASDVQTVVQKLTSMPKPHTTTAYWTTTFTTNTRTTSQRTKSTQATKKERVSSAPRKIPLSKQIHPTAAFKASQPVHLTEETTTTVVPSETQKISSNKVHSTVGPPHQLDPKTSPVFHHDTLGSDIVDHSEIPPVPDKTEKAVSDKTSQSPPTTAVPKPAQTKKMPINLIRLHIFDEPELPSVQSVTQTTSTAAPKTTQSNKISHTRPAPKATQKVPIHVISLQIFGEPDVPMVPNTTLTTSQSTTTQRPESPHSTPVPTQKVIQPITQKPKPAPRIRTKPASTILPMDTTTKSKIPHETVVTTLAPYRLQHSSSRPRIPFRPRARPAQNGTATGTVRPRPTGHFNWAPGTVPGGRVYDSTKLLGVSRNISMEPNNTGKRPSSVSSAPLPPIRPTSIRRRNQSSNVTGRPGITVSSPPLLPVRPTTVRRRPEPNGTGRPAPAAGGILIPRARSTARPNSTMGSIKPPKRQPTMPALLEDFVDATVFSPSPKSDIDALGKTRYTAPHVKYMSKEENIPCSITESMRHFPTEEGGNQEVLNAPQNPPSNLTIVTVEGCPSFVILDWEQPDNDTVTEYEVISKENGGPTGKDQSIIVTNQTHSTVENLKPDTSYEFHVIPKNPLGEGPVSSTVEFNTESADPKVSEPVTGGKDAIWTEIKFKSDSYSECKGKQYVKRTWYKKFVGIQLCNSLRYKIYLSDTLTGTFYNIGDQSGYGEDHCQFVDSFLDGRTGQQLLPEQLTTRKGFYRSVRQQPVDFGEIGGQSHNSYVHWYECGISIPGKW